MVCQYVCPAPARKSTKARASPPCPDPEATGQGREVEKEAARPAKAHVPLAPESEPAVLAHVRSTSATLHDCAMQPRGVNGSMASNTSLIDPTHASFR